MISMRNDFITIKMQRTPLIAPPLILSVAVFLKCISRYVGTSKQELEIDLQAVNAELVDLEKKIVENTKKHNDFLKELGLPPLP